MKNAGKGLRRLSTQNMKQLQKAKCWSQGHLRRLERVPTIEVIAKEMDASAADPAEGSRRQEPVLYQAQWQPCLQHKLLLAVQENIWISFKFRRKKMKF